MSGVCVCVYIYVTFVLMQCTFNEIQGTSNLWLCNILHFVKIGFYDCSVVYEGVSKRFRTES
jgi:hypothetical protein